MPSTLISSTAFNVWILLVVLHPVARAATDSSTSSSVISATTSRTNFTSISTARPSSTSQPPFFPDPTSLYPSPQGSQGSAPSHLTKLVVTWLFTVIAFSVLTSIMIWTCYRIRLARRRRSTVISARRWRSAERDNSTAQISPSDRSPSADTANTAPIILANPFLYPSPYPQHLLQPTPYNAPRVRARDTDAGGRRLNDGVTSNDHDGELGDKDILPAYDASGSPPTYVE